MEELPRKRRKSPVDLEISKKTQAAVSPLHFSLRPPNVKPLVKEKKS